MPDPGLIFATMRMRRFRLAILTYAVASSCAATAVAQLPRAAPAAKARLGEVHYGPRVGGVIGADTALVEWRLSPVDSLAAAILSVRVGLTARPDFRVVQCVRVVYLGAGGTPDTAYLGRPDGADWQPEVSLNVGQQLVGLSGAGGWFVDALQLHFSDGAVSPRYGGPGGDVAFATQLRELPGGGGYRGRLLGFYGTERDGLLESIGLVWWPVE